MLQVNLKSTLITVLNNMMGRRVSSVPVVDDSGQLVDIYTKFDVIVSPHESTGVYQNTFSSHTLSRNTWNYHRSQDRVVIVRAEKQLTIRACSAESANAAAHAPTVSCLVRADQTTHWDLIGWLGGVVVSVSDLRLKRSTPASTTPGSSSGQAAYTYLPSAAWCFDRLAAAINIS